MTDENNASDSLESTDEQSFDDYFTEFSAEDSGEDAVNDSDDPVVSESETVLAEDNSSTEAVDEQADEPGEAERLRQEIEAIKQERDELSHKYKSQVGRVSALHRKINGNQQSVIDENEQFGDGEEDAALPNSSSEVDAELSELLEDYPDIAKPLIKLFERKVQAIESQLQPLTENQNRQFIDSQLLIMDSQHPDWRNTVASNEYKQWLGQQPDAVQSMQNSVMAKDYRYLIEQFNRTRTANNTQAVDIVERRKQKLATNETIKSTGQSKKSLAPDDFDSAWSYYATRNK